MEEKTKLNMQMYDAESILAPLQKLNLMDDFLFDAATGDLETCRIIIELSLGIRIRNIAWKEGQKVIRNLPGNRGIRMDFYVEDDRGRVFDVEMQKRNEGNIPKRTRFYQALIDAPMLKSGERGFDSLKPAYIVVICGFDLYGYGLYRYTFDNRCKELPDLVMGDECSKIILNTKGGNEAGVDRALIDFLHYVEKSSEESVPEGCDERLKHLHKKIHQIKMSEEIGVSYMKMEERDRLIRDEGLRRGRAEGKAEGRAEGRAEGESRLIGIIRRKVSRGMGAAEIADLLEIPCAAAEAVTEALMLHPDWTDLQIAEELLSGENLADSDLTTDFPPA